MLTNQEIVEDVVAQFGEKLFNLEEPYGLLTMTIQREDLMELIGYLTAHDKFRFSFLTDITGIHIPDNKGAEFGVIYHLHSWEKNIRVRIKVFLSEEDLHVPTLTGIFAGANWMERETFDFYGIIFTGHPNLKRILNLDEMDYFPMRKEYPLEDGTREDKIDALFGR